MPADRHDRDALFDQLLADVLDLADPRVHVVLVEHLLDAARHRLEVAAGEAAVGVQALEHDEAAGLLEQLLVERRQEAADVGQQVLLGADRGAVGVRAHLAQDVLEALVGVAVLALLDEPRVLGGARRVEVDLDAVALSSRIARRFSIDTGWPPAMFTVTATLTYGMKLAPTRAISASSLPMSTLPLKGSSIAGLWASSMMTSTVAPPARSWCSRS